MTIKVKEKEEEKLINKVGRPKKKSNRGRKPFDGKSEEEVLRKLRSAYDFGATDIEACVHAGISVSTLHKYMKANPKFKEERVGRKQTPILAAKKLLCKDLETNVETAKWYLERKRKDEFSTKAIITGEILTAEMDEKDAKRVREVLASNGELDE